MHYEETEAFSRDLKKLLKRYRSLKDDLEGVKKNAIELFHCTGLDNQSVFRIPNTGTDTFQFYKVKKFACKALKGKGNRSGMRLIYCYIAAEQKVIFLELYHKSDQADADKDRMKDFLSSRLSHLLQDHRD